MTAYLNHVTLNTGDTRRSPRAEIGDRSIEVAGQVLRAALASPDRVPLAPPPLSHYAITADDRHGPLVIIVEAPVGPHVAGRPHQGETIPIATMAVVRRDRQGNPLWRMLAAQLDHPVGAPPATPWLGVVLHPSIGAFPDAAVWLGDLERCLAWAWLETPRG